MADVRLSDFNGLEYLRRGHIPCVTNPRRPAQKGGVKPPHPQADTRSERTLELPFSSCWLSIEHTLKRLSCVAPESAPFPAGGALLNPTGAAETDFG